MTFKHAQKIAETQKVQNTHFHLLDEELKKELIKSLKGEILVNEPMNKHTTLRVGNADLMVFPLDETDLQF